MKRLLVLFILLVVSNCYGVSLIGSGIVAAGGGCSATFTNDVAGSVTSIGQYANRYFKGSIFNDGTERSVCQVDFKLGLDGGSITGKTYYCAIYSLSGSDLDALQGTSSGVTGSDAWDSTVVSFEFSSSVVIPSSTDRAIVVYQDVVDGTNYAEVIQGISAASWIGDNSSWESDKIYKSIVTGYEPYMVVYCD